MSVVFQRQRLSFALLTGLCLAVVSWERAEAADPVKTPGGGLRVLSVTYNIAPSSSAPYPRPPLEGPLVTVAVGITDQRSDDFDWFASKHSALTGDPLPGATESMHFALLDSGAATHLVGYLDALGAGVEPSHVTGNRAEVSGVSGAEELDVSDRLGYFVHGLNDLGPGDSFQPSKARGQGNFALLANDVVNYLDDITIPSVAGAPIFNDFAFSVTNSAPVEVTIGGETIRSPSVGVFASATDPALPADYAHRVLLEYRGPDSGTDVVFIPEFGNIEFPPASPSAISAGSLIFTRNTVTLTNNGSAAGGQFMVDTGAQATIIGLEAAAELGLNPNAPDFEVEVLGIGGTTNVPGFYIDTLRLPALGGTLLWSEVPVVLLDLPSPEGPSEFMYGVLGMNLFGNRDYVFNAIAASPYLDVSSVRGAPAIEIEAMRFVAPDIVEVDWFSEPAAPELWLETVSDLSSTNWTPVQKGDLASIRGTLVYTGASDQVMFRLNAPLTAAEAALLP